MDLDGLTRSLPDGDAIGADAHQPHTVDAVALGVPVQPACDLGGHAVRHVHLLQRHLEQPSHLPQPESVRHRPLGVVAHERDLTAYALERLAEVPNLRIIGPRTAGEHRGTAISFAIEGVHPHDVAEIIARDNICIRAGHHCAQPLMRRLGTPATSRASFGVHNTRADVDKLVDSLATVRSIFGL